MCKFSFFLIIIFCTCLTYGQNIDTINNLDTIRFNRKWEKTTNKNDYYYYRVIEYDKLHDVYNTTDHYPDGKVQMTGQYLSKETKIKNGNFTWYYPTEMKMMYQLYKNDILLIDERFDQTGKTIQKVLKKEYIDSLSISEKEKLGISKSIDEPAQFPGGENKLIEYEISHIIYPSEAVKEKIEGKVFVRFTISKNGRPQNATTLYNPSPLLEKEAIRMVLAMPNWIPGKNNGVIVEDSVLLPIVFKLK